MPSKQSVSMMWTMRCDLTVIPLLMKVKHISDPLFTRCLHKYTINQLYKIHYMLFTSTADGLLWTLLKDSKSVEFWIVMFFLFVFLGLVMQAQNDYKSK